MAMKKPVIGLISGEGVDIINKSNSGICSNTSNYKELKLKIQKFIRLDKSELDKIGRNGYNIITNTFQVQKKISVSKTFQIKKPFLRLVISYFLIYNLSYTFLIL